MSFLHKLQRAQQLGPKKALAELNRRLRHHLTLSFRRLRARISPPTLTISQLEKKLPGLAQADWHRHFTTRTSPRVFPGLEQLKATAELINRQCPLATQATLKAAAALCQHQFYFFFHQLGHEPDAVNWLDGWPRKHYTEIVYGAALTPPRDIKFTWEIGRFLQASTLGRAYALTNDEQFATEFFSQLESFDRASPCEFGPHWLCAMEVGIRTVNLITGFYFFRHSPGCTPERVARLLRMLYEHACFIEQNLENTHHITSNHYLSDLVGLLFIGVMFPEFDKSHSWRAFAWRELLTEFDKQVYPDGADFEASTSYHRLVTELFAYSFWLGEHNELQLPDEARSKLARMFEFTRTCLRPDGLIPQIGDTDNGQLLTLAERHPIDHAYLPFLGVALGLEVTLPEFNPEYRQHVTAALPDQCRAPEPQAEAIWVSGRIPEGRVEPSISTAFPDAGIYVLRQADDFLIVYCGDNGIGGFGSHGHNDALAFEVWSKGRAWLVDAGTYSYTGNLEARHLFRSTEFHNTARIDGQEIKPILKSAPFSLGANVQPRVRNWKTGETEDLLEAEHDGFQRLPDKIHHQRRILFNKPDREWVIEDRFISEPSQTKHLIELFFNFDAGITIESATGSQIIAKDDQSRSFYIQTVHSSVVWAAEVVNRWVSYGYGHRTNSQGVVWSVESKLPVIVTWRMFAI